MRATHSACQLARDEARIDEAPDADRQVEALLDEIDEAIGEREIDVHLRVAREELGEERRDVALPEDHRHRHAQACIALEDLARKRCLAGAGGRRQDQHQPAPGNG